VHLLQRAGGKKMKKLLWIVLAILVGYAASTNGMSYVNPFKQQYYKVWCVKIGLEDKMHLLLEGEK
jgi:hypothetical protein